ncbi:Domain of unknown function DUF2344 [Syntrophomonas zehnderi OL-4]|uniref:DUF2344 domain-containing protein n=1 Tax=Syntrophomonas zehnderi OL-4 TaxID=690567 RepID=A0A0E3W3G1_9FIRM|nr:TIGR03936 family radical SAM-associated protein [Syntrophomonas zehnderi]CFX80385.1 Domain of unknown function DUF2344 [Syntrophomonas zehnderi OL-4]
MRLRAEYRVGPNLKFLGNLDMMHLLERALRRAEIPYRLTEGFNPHIKLSMGTVLPVGLWGENEYFDLELDEMAPQDFKNRINVVLPPDMQIKQCIAVPMQAASLMKTINTAQYDFILKPGQNAEYLVTSLLDCDKILVQSRGKNKQLLKDLRPGLYDMQVEPGDGFEVLAVMVSVNEPLNIRFDELLAVFAENGLKSENLLDFFRRGNYIREESKYYSPLEKV